MTADSVAGWSMVGGHRPPLQYRICNERETMLKTRAALLRLAFLLLAIPASNLAQDAKTILANVSRAMGADNLRTIQLSGMGSNAGIGQNTSPNTRWPLVRVKTYTQEIDFAATASHV